MDFDEINALQNIFCHSDLTKNEEFVVLNLFVNNLKLSKSSLEILKSQQTAEPSGAPPSPLSETILPLLKLQKSPHNSYEMNIRIQQCVLKIFQNLLYIFND